MEYLSIIIGVYPKEKQVPSILITIGRKPRFMRLRKRLVYW
jgi:hypothetical protein